MNEFVSKLDDLLDVAQLDVMKLLDEQQQQFLSSQREKGREGCLDHRIINVTFVKQSSSADEIMQTHSERAEIAQEESNDKMRTHKS